MLTGAPPRTRYVSARFPISISSTSDSKLTPRSRL